MPAVYDRIVEKCVSHPGIGPSLEVLDFGFEMSLCEAIHYPGIAR